MLNNGQMESQSEEVVSEELSELRTSTVDVEESEPVLIFQVGSEQGIFNTARTINLSDRCGDAAWSCALCDELGALTFNDDDVDDAVCEADVLKRSMFNWCVCVCVCVVEQRV